MNDKKCEHDFCVWKDGCIAEGNEIELECNYTECKETKIYKIVNLILEEIK